MTFTSKGKINRFRCSGMFKKILRIIISNTFLGGTSKCMFFDFRERATSSITIIILYLEVAL